jgi:hypothetical protein
VRAVLADRACRAAAEAMRAEIEAPPDPEQAVALFGTLGGQDAADPPRRESLTWTLTAYGAGVPPADPAAPLSVIVRR